ncbi:MAG: AtpZ/AtpI family protein [Myxococcota bacterium]
MNDTDKPGHEPGEDNGDEQSPWLTVGVFGALGFEFVGFILGGYVVGQAIDTRLDSYPIATLTCIALGLVGVLWHTYRISKKFLE